MANDDTRPAMTPAERLNAAAWEQKAVQAQLAAYDQDCLRGATAGGWVTVSWSARRYVIDAEVLLSLNL